MAIGTRYSQEFKEDAVRYRLEHPEIALRKYNSMLTLIVHFYFPLNVHIYFIESLFLVRKMQKIIKIVRCMYNFGAGNSRIYDQL